MKRRLQILAAFLLGTVLSTACAAVTYRYYSMQMPGECYDKGKLLGKLDPGGWPDLDMTACQPTAASKAPCFVMTSAEHFAADKELLNLRQALKDCQAGPRPGQ